MAIVKCEWYETKTQQASNEIEHSYSSRALNWS
jgi:hypothetical protein